MFIFNTEIINRIFYYLSDIKDVYKLITLNRRFLQCYRNTDVMVFCNKAKNKQEKLKIFISYYEYLPKQGSIEWIQYRQGSDLLPPVIGGSEIKNLLKAPKTIAKHKLKIDNFSGNIHTRWGNIFEEVFGQIIDSIFYTQSKETGSIPGLRNNFGQVVQSYSPDRLLIADTARLTEAMLNPANDAVQMFADKLYAFQQQILAKKESQVIVLCEFKCPSVRIPNGLIPDEYTLQPPIGLATIPIADIAIFANNSIRKCRIADFDLLENYDKKFHAKDAEYQAKDKNLKFNKPLFMGFVGVYKKSTKAFAKDYLITPEKLTKQKLKQLLDQHMKCEVANANSDHYLTELQYSNVASLTTICLEFILRNNYNDSIIIEYLTEKLQPPDPQLFAEIIQDIIWLYYKKNNVYKDFGEDFGMYETSKFESIAKDIVDNRFNQHGLKAYYDVGLLVNYQVAKNFNIVNNQHIYIAKSNADCVAWMHKKQREFVQYCQNNNFDPVGIIPYKMFKLCMIPVFAQKNFIDPYIEPIMEFTEMIQDIKQKARQNKISATDLTEFYSNCLDEYYGASKKSTKKEYFKYEKESNIFDQETMDEFNTLNYI